MTQQEKKKRQNKKRTFEIKRPKDVYVCDFYSRQLDEIKGLLVTLIIVNIISFFIVFLRFF